MSRKLDLLANIEAERSVLGACMISDAAAETAVSMLEPGDFFVPRHADIFAAITAQMRLGSGRVDPVTLAAVSDSPDAAKYLWELVNATPTTSNVGHYAELVAGWKLRRDLVFAAEAITRLAFDESPTVDPSDAADQARGLLANLDMPARVGAPDPDVDSFMASVDTAYDWLIPDFLERRDRMLVTASEGAGKSVLLRQIAVMCAAGIHPWSHIKVPPRNVLIVDLENSDRQMSRSLSWLRKQAGVDLDPQRLRVHGRSGLDLTTRTDRRWLMERCQANATELLVIGPLYRMSSGVAQRGDVGGEDAARRITAALDEVRVRCGVTLLMETHAPHANDHGRDLRPFGSSVWLRWPEFGIGLRRHEPDNPNVYDVNHWRGPRDVRVWPSQLTKNAGRWPWSPTMPNGTFRSAA